MTLEHRMRTFVNGLKYTSSYSFCLKISVNISYKFKKYLQVLFSTRNF